MGWSKKNLGNWLFQKPNWCTCVWWNIIFCYRLINIYAIKCLFDIICKFTYDASSTYDMNGDCWSTTHWIPRTVPSEQKITGDLICRSHAACHHSSSGPAVKGDNQSDQVQKLVCTINMYSIVYYTILYYIIMSLYILIWYRIMEGGYPKSCKSLKPIVLWAILCHKSEYHHVIHWVSQLACCGKWPSK